MFENYLFGYIACSIFDPWDEELVESAGNIDSFGQIVDFFGILLLIAFVAVVFAVVSVICKGIRKRRLIDPVEDHVTVIVKHLKENAKMFERIDRTLPENDRLWIFASLFAFVIVMALLGLIVFICLLLL